MIPIRARSQAGPSRWRSLFAAVAAGLAVGGGLGLLASRSARPAARVALAPPALAPNSSTRRAAYEPAAEALAPRAPYAEATAKPRGNGSRPEEASSLSLAAAAETKPLDLAPLEAPRLRPAPPARDEASASSALATPAAPARASRAEPSRETARASSPQSFSASASAARRAAGRPGGRRARLTGFMASAPGASGARPSVLWPTLGQLTSAMAADAAAYAASAPPIASDAASGFAIVTSLAGGSSAAPGASSGGGFGAGGGSGGGGGGTGGGAPGPAPAPKKDDTPDSKPDKPASSHGIPWRAAADATGLIFPDISVWRKPHSWDALNRASSGIIVLKVRQVRIDPTFNDGLEEAEKRKMIVIGYAFGYGADGAMQADALLQNFSPKPGRILMLDLEHNPYGSEMTDSQAIAFVERIKARTGKYPFLYTSASRRRPGALAKCPRYVAQWGSKPAESDIWQFTNGVVGPPPHSFPGVGSCDINRLTMTYGRLRGLAGLDSKRDSRVASAY